MGRYNPAMNNLNDALLAVLRQPGPTALVALQEALLAGAAPSPERDSCLALAGQFHRYLVELQARLTARQYSELASWLDMTAVGLVAFEELIRGTASGWRDLLIDARGRLGRARLLNVFAHVGDGHEGWSDDGPYDRIVLNCAVAEIPPPLFDQLKPGGVIVAPIGAGDEQRLMRFRNDAEEDLGPVRFAPLLRGLGEEPETA